MSSHPPQTHAYDPYAQYDNVYDYNYEDSPSASTSASASASAAPTRQAIAAGYQPQQLQAQRHAAKQYYRYSGGDGTAPSTAAPSPAAPTSQLPALRGGQQQQQQQQQPGAGSSTMADSLQLPPSYDSAVASPSGSHQTTTSSPPDASYIDYSAYTDYIEATDAAPDTSPYEPAHALAPANDAAYDAATAELEDQFGSLNVAPTSAGPSYGAAAPNQFPSPYGAASGLPRQRSVTDGYVGTRSDPSASVYSLDSTGGYPQQGQVPPMPRPYGAGPGPGPAGGPPPSWNPNFQGRPSNNAYYSAATDFVGLPPSSQPRYAPVGGQPPGPPSRQPSLGNLERTNTTRSTLSMASVQSAPLPQRRASETFGAPSTARRGIVAIDVSKPPYTRQFVDEYRTRMKNDPDPEAQFSFAKYLIEAAKKIGDEMSARDPRSGRKYRDSLLAESLRNIKKLAEGKDPYADAQFFLANLYGTGQLGLQVDHERAYYLYLMASKAGHPAATYRAAVCCELGAGTKRDPGRAVLFHRKAAALGDTAAMYKLGLILLNGTSEYKKNPIEAHKWLRRAAEQGDEDNPHALFELALLHERPNNGTGGAIPFDPGLARGYLTQAAQLGYAPAQFKLGQCHEFGWLGFPIDPRRSIAWYTRAAERGDSEAELALSGWYLTGSEGVLKQSDTEAYLWGRKAANKGLAKAEYAVGYYTETGIGVKQDLELAKRWYQRASSQGNKRAMQRLQEINNKAAGAKGRPTRKDAESECVVM